MLKLKDFDSKNGLKHELLQTMNISVRNPNLAGLSIRDVPIINSDEIVCSRLKRGEHLMVPMPNTILELGDLIHLVGQRQDLENARLVIGDQVDTSLSTRGTELQVSRVVVTNEKYWARKSVI